MSRRSIIIVAAVILAGVAIFAGVKWFTAPGAPAGMPEHGTIAQAMEKSGQIVKVGGDVVPGSIAWDDATRSLRFTLTGEGDQMPVAYAGRAPNDFKPGSALVVEGTYTVSGIFHATSITTRSSPLCKACHG
ncbi:MAG: cytochrome c maturation protein CcmE [Dehalococcoidales bacterium]|nr:cytochrome c maturation protein CcmE [Dehalococcoidales bacterium]